MRALLSVSNKENLVGFAEELVKLGFEIIATGGTKNVLEANNIKVTYVEEVTGFKEILDGRVKTLHPKIHGAILARRDLEEHMATLIEENIIPIDLVCVNLYPFKETISRPNVSLADAIENIDIGGPSMVRSAAKNHRDVIITCDPKDYDEIINRFKNNTLDYDFRQYLCLKAFRHTAAYDMEIANYFAKVREDKDEYFISAKLNQGLRYGENPHQSANFYSTKCDLTYSLSNAKQLHGKELSYNNIQDANAALMITSEFSRPFALALKHMNPCGAALGETIEEAFQKAYDADSVSIFGGIVSVNREVTKELALLMKPIFLEVILAPKFSDEALEVLTTKKNLRLIEYKIGEFKNTNQVISVNGGLLVQELDGPQNTITLTKDMCVTEENVDDKLLKDLDFANRICKHVKSNAIVLCSNECTCGIGAGQMNRIGSLEIALNEAKNFKHDTNLVLASDGFFPFDDCVTLASQYDVKAIVQPGGSIRDEDSIKACNTHKIPMLFSGRRHFKH